MYAYVTCTYVCMSFTFCSIDKLLEMSEWSLMHPLFLFHFLFYFLATICSDGIEQLRDSGVIDLIVKELWMIQLIPKWHKVIINAYVVNLYRNLMYIHTYICILICMYLYDTLYCLEVWQAHQVQASTQLRIAYKTTLIKI